MQSSNKNLYLQASAKYNGNKLTITTQHRHKQTPICTHRYTHTPFYNDIIFFLKDTVSVSRAFKTFFSFVNGRRGCKKCKICKHDAPFSLILAKEKPKNACLNPGV